MTSEQRLDRLEGIAKLFAKAGLRARSETRRQYEILMDAQLRNEARFARNEERFAKLAESQVHTDRRLDALIDIIREGRQGNSSPSTS
ncbi:MAG TPA: hypothetical protein VGW36_01570 [Pyrinomonadaceae bacterium]|nr:hypothetical protein [Pyrinomonadaceae bacterium]